MTENLPDKLLGEPEGILALAVAGAKAWYVVGLSKPLEVETANQEWHSDMDQIGRFCAECCLAGDGYSVWSSEIYFTYKHWAQRAGEDEVLSQRAFWLKLNERDGIRNEHTNQGTRYRGIGLRERQAD